MVQNRFRHNPPLDRTPASPSYRTLGGTLEKSQKAKQKTQSRAV
jgi:hypothetical protein